MDVRSLLNHHPFRIDSLLNHDDIGTRFLPCSKRRRIDHTLHLASPTSVVSWPVNTPVKPSLLELSDPALQPQPQTPSSLPERPVPPIRSSVRAERRLAQSRIVGQRHRIAERQRSATLAEEVDALKAEHEELLSVVESMTIKDTNNQVYAIRGRTARILGTTQVTGQAALTLLQLIALRRNLDRPGLVIECPIRAEVDDAVSEVNDGFELKVLRELHENWARHEVGQVHGEEEDVLWEKRCTRCDMLKSAGSGHPRSFCDDGFKVGSNVPYRRGAGVK